MNCSSPVWLLLDSRKMGGIESHVLQLAIGLAKHHINVEVIFIANYGDHPLKNLLSQAKIPFRSLSFGLISLILASYKQQPAIIHTHGYKAGIIGRIAGVMTRCKIVSTFHCGELFSGKLAFYNYLDRHSAQYCDAVIAVSAQIGAQLSVHAKLLNNFVPVNHAFSLGKQIAFVGRLSEEKGPDTFVHLASVLPEQTFHIYGDGPLRQHLESVAANNLIFHGHINNMSDYWPDIGLLVIPSRYEGLPMAALEAMSRGIPVAAYQVGSLNKVICHKTGWLSSAGNFLSLQHSIYKWLHCSIKQRRMMSRRCRSKITEQFSDKAVIPQVIALYQQVIQSKENSGHLLN